MPANRPHFHIWKQCRPKKDGHASQAMFRLAKSFWNAQTAGQWMRRREPDKSKWMVRRCECEHCKPELD